jgi:hypothetical protein
MNRARRLLSPAKLLIAAIAICAAAPSAKADLFLEISDSTHAPTLVDLGPTGGTGTKTFDGYTITYTASASSNSLTLDASVKNVSNTSSALSLNLFSSGTTGGYYSALPGALTLSSTLDVKSISGTNSASTSELGGYTPYGGSTSSTSLVTSTNSTGSVTGLPTPVTGGTSFDLSTGDMVSNATGGALKTGATGHFVATTTVALPEPTGIAAALAGLPCLGMVLGFARRRRAGQVEAAPAV